MPIFEYRCRGCGHGFEHFVRGTARAPGCPACGCNEVERQMSLAAVSSEHTRNRAKSDIRRRNRALRADHAREEVKRIEAHAHDHD